VARRSSGDDPVDRAPASNWEHPSSAAYRRRAAADRTAAHECRVRAAADRAKAATGRAQAARDRAHAEEERVALCSQLARAEADGLASAPTGVSGLADLGHEIDRARRGSGILAVAYVDIVELSNVNDRCGHTAGDALLSRAVEAIRARLRSYDLSVCLGGDEFLFVLSDAMLEDATRRFGSIQTALAADPDPFTIRVGFAALAPGESSYELVARAGRARTKLHDR
jgi:diguanylate cyclase (GGDEF)-like protein